MSGRAFSAFPILLLLAAIGWAAAVPVQLQGGMNMLQREDYGSPAGEYLAKYLDDRGVAGGAGSGHLVRQAHRGLDALPGSTFVENKGFLPSRRVGSLLTRPISFEEIDRLDRFAKRNIDEIDRTPFDSFFKRNLDEIDHVGWSGFVKRLEDYQAGRQRL